MARRVALIPEELVSTYNLQKPEIRLEDEIELLLERSKLPDDMKAKLLGEMITRYHRIVHAPAEPVKVSIENESETADKTTPENDSEKQREEEDIVLKDIMFTVPKRFSQYVLMIIEKLKSREYAWNEMGEMTVSSQPIKGSSIVDFFNYMTRNSRNLEEPRYFSFFAKAIKEINIPKAWIGNQDVKTLIEKIDEKSITKISSRDHIKKVRRSRSHTSLSSLEDSPNRKWLEY